MFNTVTIPVFSLRIVCTVIHVKWLYAVSIRLDCDVQVRKIANRLQKKAGQC